MLVRSQFPAFRFGFWLALLFLLLGASGGVRADLTLTLEARDGDKISDIAKITAKVDSPDGIDKVEFLVDGEARLTKNGTPYFYNWDTIADKEGEHTLTVIAYDSNGNTKKLETKLVIENELATGASVFSQKALDALAKKDYDTTTKFARRSLKVEPGNAEGSRALAAVFAARENWVKAAEMLSKAKDLDSNASALAALADYKMQNALLRENVAIFSSEYQAASDLRRKSFDIKLKELTAKYAGAGGKEAIQAHEIIGDTLMEAGRYLEAATEYNKNVLADGKIMTSVNRLALAYAMADHYDEANGILRPAIRAKQDDAVTRAVYGLALLRQRKFDEARAAVQSDLDGKTKPAISLIVAAYMDSTRDYNKEGAAEAKAAIALLPDAPESHYALALASPDLLTAEKELVRAMALSDFYAGPFLMYAGNVALGKRTDRYDQALNITDTVLKMDSDNLYAKIVQSLVYLQKGQSKDAEPLLNVLARREQTASDVQMTLAAYWSVKNKGAQAVASMREAHRLDKEHFDFAGVPTPLELLEFLNRKTHYRSGFFLSPSSLYPPKPEPAPATTTPVAAP